MYDVSAILAQHAGNLETFHIQKHAEERAAYLAAHGIPCLIRKVEQARDPGGSPGSPGAGAEPIRRRARDPGLYP